MEIKFSKHPDKDGFYKIKRGRDNPPRYIYRENQNLWELYHQCIRGSLTVKTQTMAENILSILEEHHRKGYRAKMPLRGSARKPELRKNSKTAKRLINHNISLIEYYSNELREGNR